MYTGGDYFLGFLEFLKVRIESCRSFDNILNCNQNNMFLVDIFVALKRIDFNVKPYLKTKTANFFIFVFNKIESKQHKFLLISKFLDMDYQETFF